MMHSPTHHPTEDMLLEHAAGTLPEAVSMVIAAHLTLCPACRTEVRRFESIGGALLEQAEPAALAGGFAALMARIDRGEGEQEAPPSPRPSPSGDEALYPRPILRYLEGGAPHWRKVTPSLSEHVLAVAGRPRLMRIRAGRPMPRHTHEGEEMVLVLRGGFSDSTGHYLRGDLALADGAIDHQPAADEDTDCICLSLVQGSLRLTGPIGRLINRFISYR